MTLNPETLSAPSPPPKRYAAGLILLCFFLSGASGLVYEVVWTRMLVLVFGSTTFAISAVLTAFMAGLAAGSWFAGRLIDRSRIPVVWYGALEFGIGLYAIAVPAIFASLTPLYQYVWKTWHPDAYAAALIRFALSFVILLIPTVLMGATLPVLSKFFAHRSEEIGLSVGRLYAINTFGAVVGAFSAGFVLLPHLGVHNTIYCAAATNVILAITVFIVWWQPHASLSKIPAHTPSPAPPRSQAPTRSLPRTVVIALCCSAASGFIAMVYEVAWSRVLSLILGSSVYAFSVMLTTFLIGLALGGYLFARVADRIRSNGLIALALLQFGVGLSAFLTMHLFQELPWWFTFLFKRVGSGEVELLATRFLLAGAVMLLPTLCLGAMFPVVVSLCSDDLTRVGASVGRVYSANTVGAILGSFAGGFLLIPGIGIQPTLVAAVAGNMLLAAVVFLFCVQWNAFSRTLLTIGGALAAWSVVLYQPAWNPLLMTSGMYHYAPGLQTLDRASFNDFTQGHYDLLYYKEGITTTVTVAGQKGDGQKERNIWLATNGKIDASSVPDMPTQVLSAHIPLLLHPNPKDVLVIGLASGVTVGSVQQHPIASETCIEIEPAVREATRRFTFVNHNALDDPRLRLEFNDGRNYLLLSDRKFDVIISEPSNPWISGPSNLFTRECFETGKRALTPGGFYAQWVQLYGMTPPNLKSLIKTFHSVFPEVLVFQTIEQADLILVGSESRFKIDVQQVARRMTQPKIAEDMARVNVFTIGDLLARFRLGTNELDSYAGEVALNTDDNLLIEFAAPKSLYAQTRESNAREIALHHRCVLPYLTNLGDTPDRQARVLMSIAQTFLQANCGLESDARQLIEASVRVEQSPQ